jgi:HTH-type transcriptional regulator/antitoxin HigA
VNPPRRKLSGRFDALVAMSVPRQILDDTELDEACELVDQLMRIGRPTRGQTRYMLTWVALIEAYEREHHAIDTSDLTGLDSLKFLMDEHEMSAADLQELLGLSRSHTYSILQGRRELTVNHIRKLAGRFNTAADLFV